MKGRVGASILFLIFSVAVAKKVTDAEIMDIYNTFIRVYHTHEYRHRYVPLPLEKNTLAWKWEGKDFPRVIALLEFAKFVRENKISSTKALVFNGSNDPELLIMNSDKTITIDYDEKSGENDLHELDLTEKDYDFVMTNQTLEHIYDPVLCLKNIYKHMRSGGILYVNVPANSILHSTPFHHFTGYTPWGLGAIASAAGFNILSIGQWGNLEYFVKMYSSNDWPDYRQLTNPGYNDLEHPIITWIFAQKP